MACNCNSDIFDVPVLPQQDWMCGFDNGLEYPFSGVTFSYKDSYSLITLPPLDVFQTGGCWDLPYTTAAPEVATAPACIQSFGNPVNNYFYTITYNSPTTAYQAWDYSGWASTTGGENVLIFGATSMYRALDFTGLSSGINAYASDSYIETAYSPWVWMRKGEVCTPEVIYTAYNKLGLTNAYINDNSIFYPGAQPFYTSGVQQTGSDYTLDFLDSEVGISLEFYQTFLVPGSNSTTVVSAQYTGTGAAWQIDNTHTTLTGVATTVPITGMYRLKITGKVNGKYYKSPYVQAGAMGGANDVLSLTSGVIISNAKLLQTSAATGGRGTVWGLKDIVNISGGFGHGVGPDTSNPNESVLWNDYDSTLLGRSDGWITDPTCGGGHNGSIQGRLTFPDTSGLDYLDSTKSATYCYTGSPWNGPVSPENKYFPNDGTYPQVATICHTKPSGVRVIHKIHCNDISNDGGAGSDPYYHDVSFTGLGAGIHRFELFDYAHGKFNIYKEFELIDNPPVFGVSIVQQPSYESLCGNVSTCDGILSASVAGGVAPFTYLWSNGATTQTISGLCSGTYSCVVTDSIGCTSDSYLAELNNTFSDGVELSNDLFNCLINNLSIEAMRLSAVGNKGYKEKERSAYLLIALRDAVVSRVCPLTINDMCGFVQENFADCSVGGCTNIVSCV